jgi:hypothetical protein
LTSPGAWSRPPEGMPGRGETEGFARRTRKNLDFIVYAHQQQNADVHVVTQVVLSLLGIVVFPFERLASGRHDPNLEDLEAKGWPGWRYASGSSAPATLWELMRHLRHATAHSNIAFSSDSRYLNEVEITFVNKPPHGKRWEASIQGDQLLRFCHLFLARMEGLAG